MTTADACTGYGANLGCDTAKTTVTWLDLRTCCRQTPQPWPTAIFNLANLTYLDLSQTAFSSPLPVQFATLHNLYTFRCTACQLRGDFVTFSTSISILELSNNVNMNGKLSVGYLTNLTSLNMAYNPFTLFDTSELCNLPNLHLVNIRLVSALQQNTIPTCIGNLQSLVTIIFDTGLDTQGWSGAINTTNWHNLTQLDTLVLSSQAFTGDWPSTLPSSLRTLKIAGCKSTTASPFSLSRLSWARDLVNLQSLTLTSNQNLNAGQSISNAFPTNLQSVVLRSNTGLSMPFDAYPWNRSSLLISATMGHCLYGSLSNSLNGLGLQTLDLSNNQLSGSLDSVNWSSLPNLQNLLLGDNMFSAIGIAFQNGGTSLKQLYIDTNPILSGLISDALLANPNFNQINLNNDPYVSYNVSILCRRTWAYGNCFANNPLPACGYDASVCNCQVPTNVVCSRTTPGLLSSSVLPSLTFVVTTTSDIVSFSLTATVLSTSSEAASSFDSQWIDQPEATPVSTSPAQSQTLVIIISSCIVSFALVLGTIFAVVRYRRRKLLSGSTLELMPYADASAWQSGKIVNIDTVLFNLMNKMLLPTQFASSSFPSKEDIENLSFDLSEAWTKSDHRTE